MYISPGQGAYSLQGTKFWCLQKLPVTSVICCYFQIIDDNSFWNIYIFIFFPYKKHKGSKFDLAVKQVKVNPVSSFEQTW